MAATLAQLGQISQQTAFQQRVAAALNEAAFAIYNNEQPSVQNHAIRAAYAQRVASGGVNPGSQAIQAACLLMLGQPTLAGKADPAATDNGILDSDIAGAVTLAWNLLAGA